MTNSVNTKKAVIFLDDRNKHNFVIVMKKILFENKDICLCEVECKEEEIEDVFLFSKRTGEVLNSNWYSFIAENKK